MGRGVIIALIVSATLNIFAVGFFSGRVLSDWRAPAQHERLPDRRDGDSPFRLMRHAEALEPQARDALRAAFRAHLPAMREAHRVKRELRGELTVLLRADALDRPAIDAKLAEIDAADTRQREAFNVAFIEALSVLSPEDRQKLMEIAENDRRGHRHKKRRHAPED